MNRLDGICFSVPMFFHADGRMDLATLERYLQDTARQPGVSCLYAMAFNTRYLQLTEDEIFEVNMLVCDIARRHQTECIIGHPIGLSEMGLERFCKRISSLRPSAVSVLYPERYFGQHAPVLSYLGTPARHGLQTIIHEMKLVSGFDGSLVDWDDALVDAAMSLTGVAGIKEDSKNDALTRSVLERYRDECNVIVAGGGKRRALALQRSTGIRTWLNGSLMLNAAPTQTIYNAIIGHNDDVVECYLREVEAPYFEEIVTPLGWHVAHKLALHVAGYGSLAERLPMPVATPEQVRSLTPRIERVLSAMRAFSENRSC